ncbi:MAG: HIT family protein [Paludibacteraceae bacterium]|jgi:histidine triad (HIT) family protein|nr:HIT family protein [Paludibacteraceae bacterium]
MATIFTKIIKGEIPCYKIAENDKFFAFLDINPMTKGHTLVIPKLTEPEEDYIFKLEEETYNGLMSFAREVAIAIEKAVPCKRIGVAVMGMEVPHVHVHLIPINKESDMIISNPKLQLTKEEMSEIAEKIAANF